MHQGFPGQGYSAIIRFRFRHLQLLMYPTLEAAVGNKAEAYQLRYLARRAIRSNTPHSPALGMMLRALSLSPRLLIEEPARTLVTLGAAVAQRALPSTLFSRFEAMALERMTRATVRV